MPEDRVNSSILVNVKFQLLMCDHPQLPSDLRVDIFLDFVQCCKERKSFSLMHHLQYDSLNCPELFLAAVHQPPTLRPLRFGQFGAIWRTWAAGGTETAKEGHRPHSLKR